MAGIAEFINRFMKDHRLTEKKMAALIGMRSSAQFMKLASGQGGGAAAVEFEQAMLRSFELTALEREELRRCVREDTAGGDIEAIKTREMWAYLRGEDLQTGAFYLETPVTGRVMTLSERYAAAKNLRIMLLNTPYSTVYPDLMRLMDERGAKIDHYVMVGDDDVRTIRLTNDIQRPIVHPNYECFVRVEEKNEQCCYGLARADLMICAWEDASGKLWRDMIVFTAPNRGRLLERPGSAAPINAVGVEEEKYMRVKRGYQEKGTLEGYVRMIEAHAEMEKDGAVYMLRPDLPISSVPADVLRDAALSGGMLSLNDDTDVAIETMTQLYAARHANIAQKRQKTWIFVRRDAMEAFARTGVMSNHFWGLRPFTPAERKRILAEQLRLMQVNHGYRLFFLREDVGIRDIDLRCFEHFGTLISCGHSDYNLEKGFTEILLSHKKLMKLFEEFAQDKLTAQCSSERETRVILKKLIGMAAEADI